MSLIGDFRISFALHLYFKKSILLSKDKKFSEKFEKRYFTHMIEIVIDKKGEYELQDLFNAEHKKIEDKALLSELIRTFNNELWEYERDFLKK